MLRYVCVCDWVRVTVCQTERFVVIAAQIMPAFPAGFILLCHGEIIDQSRAVDNDQAVCLLTLPNSDSSGGYVAFCRHFWPVLSAPGGGKPR